VLSLHPQVSVRPEPFGALLYHFGTRRLSFLKDRRLLDVVQRLDGTVSLDEALADIPPAERASFTTALGTLQRTGMLHEAG
jgi:putative mycofactocin binding protein MftB